MASIGQTRFTNAGGEAIVCAVPRRSGTLTFPVRSRIACTSELISKHIQPPRRSAAANEEHCFDAPTFDTPRFADMLSANALQLVRGMRLHLETSTLLPDKVVDTGFKRLISYTASHAAGCQYCVAHQISGALHLNMSEARGDLGL